ncbi:MAG: sodium:solute symporter [Phycisphaerales bacterium]|nr:sodium:solute symporter [Phycisphaerales bacterium]
MSTLAQSAGGFGPLDWGIVGLYMLGMLAAGVFFARGRSTSAGYLLADRGIPVWAAAVSVVATSVSAATFLGAPQDAYTGNLTYLAGNAAAIIAVLIVARWFIPAFYANDVATVYQLLERRFGLTASRAASGMFLVGRLLASGARLYVAAIPVALIAFGDISVRSLLFAVAACAAVSLVYTWFGGLKAVIWTEVPQAVLFVGAAAVGIWVLLDRIPVPASEIWSAVAGAKAPDGTGKLTVLDTRFSLSGSFNLWSALFGLTLFNMAVLATDQDLAQRVLACRNAVRGAASAILSQVLGLVVALLFLVIGVLLWVFYTRPDLMGARAPGAPPDDTRTVFLNFILGHTPTGVKGLMLAGIFAAAMSSLASSMAAMASATVVDFYRPMRPDRPDRHYVRASQIAVLVWGILLAVFAAVCVVWQSQADEGIIPFAMGVMLYAYAGLLAVFVAAVFTRRGTAGSVVAAVATGAIIVGLLDFGPLLLRAVGAELNWVRPALGWRMLAGTVAAFAVCVIPRGSGPAAAWSIR